MIDLIRVRSPYIVSIDEPTQTQTKIEMYVQNYGEAAVLLKTFIKNIVSPTQTETIINISPYVKDYLENKYPTFVTSFTAEEIKMWCYVSISRYWRALPTDEWTYIDTILKVATNGNTTYSDGVNKEINSSLILLYNTSQTIYYDVNSPIVPYINVFIGGAGYKLKYTQIGSSNEDIDSFPDDEQLYKIPVYFTGYSNEGNILEIYNDATSERNTIKVLPIDECKYTPVLCSYINRFGGWDFITFFKVKKESLQVKGSDYRLNPAQWNYDVNIGQEQNFNMNGTQSIKLNTGFVDENYSDKIQDLMLSEKVLLDSIPAKLKTQSLAIKTSLMDKNINYELDFEYNYNLINDVV